MLLEERVVPPVVVADLESAVFLALLHEYRELAAGYPREPVHGRSAFRFIRRVAFLRCVHGAAEKTCMQARRRRQDVYSDFECGGGGALAMGRAGRAFMGNAQPAVAAPVPSTQEDGSAGWNSKDTLCGHAYGPQGLLNLHVHFAVPVEAG